MKVPRFVTSLRALMLAILAIGVLLAIVAYRRDRERRWVATETQFLLQYEVTSRLQHEILIEAALFVESSLKPTENFSSTGSGGSSSSGTGWKVDHRLAYEIGGRSRVLIDIDIRGGLDDVSLKPIEIQERAGEFNGRLIERLVKEYREKGWPYRFVPANPRPTAAR
jgi:hypothetical protein